MFWIIMNEKNDVGMGGGGGFIVVCCICKKIRNNMGEWVAQKCSPPQNSDAAYSHGLCPDCVKSQYGNELWYKRYEEDSINSENALG